MANIPYQLVSMAAILRDYTDPKYISDEHYKLTSVADYFYNVCFGDYDNDAKNLLPEYKAVYDKYGADYFEQVIDDMHAIDSQVTDSRKEKELLDDYNDRIRSVSASSKVCGSKSVKASSWKDQQEGGYGTIYRPDNIKVDIGDWELSLTATLDEMEDMFYFEENDEGGDGGTTFCGVGILTNKNDGKEIYFKFWLPYYIFGNLENPDEFYLDHEPYDQTELDVCDEHYVSIKDSEADDLINWELNDDIISGLYDIVDKNLYKFGYEL